MRDSPGGETAAPETLNPTATFMRTHTHVHSYAQTPTPGLYLFIAPSSLFPFIRKKRSRKQRRREVKEGGEYR